MEPIQIKIRRLSGNFDDIPLPSYATEGSSGMDLRAALEHDLVLQAGKFALIPTSLSIEIPYGYEIQVRPRSGLAAKNGVSVLNTPGTIDSDYRGEVKVILFNFSSENFVVKRGERIAQMVLSKVYPAELIETNELNQSVRGEGGFGHTGKH